MKIVVGIGNPGREYEHTRHNVGFDVVDAIAEQNGLGPVSRRRFSAHVASGPIAGERALLVKPQTYVNVSGQAARAALDWYGESVENLLVVCDDLNLALGRVRIRPGGSSGGHRGLESIADALGTHEFPRLRIGIGEPVRVPAVDFVLSRFDAEERRMIDAAVALAAQAVNCWVREGIHACMNQFNAAR